MKHPLFTTSFAFAIALLAAPPLAAEDAATNRPAATNFSVSLSNALAALPGAGQEAANTTNAANVTNATNAVAAAAAPAAREIATNEHEGTAPAAPAPEETGSRANRTSADSGTDLKAFQIIADRNIFDPSRSGGVRLRRRPATQTFYFCGVGEATQGTRYAAIFSGYGVPSKELHLGDVVNGFKLAAIVTASPTNGWRDSVQLESTNNQKITLSLGMHMRKEARGPWMATTEAEPSSSELTATESASQSSSSAVLSSSSSSADESDVLKRLRLKREQEK
jgi:hypothetical protein